MMKVRSSIALNALLVPLSIGVAQSQEKPVDPDKLPKVACSDLHRRGQPHDDVQL
jgi:hypothetical protein